MKHSKTEEMDDGDELSGWRKYLAVKTMNLI